MRVDIVWVKKSVVTVKVSGSGPDVRITCDKLSSWLAISQPPEGNRSSWPCKLLHCTIGFQHNTV